MFDVYMNHNIEKAYHQCLKPEHIVHCGGGSSEDGIFWRTIGDYWVCPNDYKSDKNLMDKYVKQWPEINTETMVIKGGGIPIPKDASKEALAEYKRLLSISRIKYIYRDNAIFVTRELLPKAK